jgi:hypothetical protein
VIIAGCLCFCTCRSRCTCCRARSHAHHGSQPIVHEQPRSSAEARLRAGHPRHSPRLAQCLVGACCKRGPSAEPTVRYHIGDEEVQLWDDHHDFYHQSESPRAPSPPCYSTLPRTGCTASHGELARCLSTLSQ